MDYLARKPVWVVILVGIALGMYVIPRVRARLAG